MRCSHFLIVNTSTEAMASGIFFWRLAYVWSQCSQRYLFIAPQKNSIKLSSQWYFESMIQRCPAASIVLWMRDFCSLKSGCRLRICFGTAIHCIGVPIWVHAVHLQSNSEKASLGRDLLHPFWFVRVLWWSTGRFIYWITFSPAWLINHPSCMVGCDPAGLKFMPWVNSASDAYMPSPWEVSTIIRAW